MHRSGFVNIIGNPNVGKSTLMNALVGERLSIITSKAQTTRHRIMGIVDGEDFQIVYSDTPGILKPAYKLQESMMNFVRGAVDDADVILYVTDTVEQSDRSDEIVERIVHSGIPAIVVINKIDLSTPEALEAIVDRWHKKMPDAEIVPVSAKEKFNMKGLLEAILRRLPVRTYGCDTPAGTLSPEWAAKLGLSEQVVIGVGNVDCHSGAVGAGICHGTVVLNLGTSACYMAVMPPEKMGDRMVEGIFGQVDGSILPGMVFVPIFSHTFSRSTSLVKI